METRISAGQAFMLLSAYGQAVGTSGLGGVSGQLFSLAYTAAVHESMRVVVVA